VLVMLSVYEVISSSTAMLLGLGFTVVVGMLGDKVGKC
jgi:hypothetical protein